jgi:hypothetical protein
VEGDDSWRKPAGLSQKLGKKGNSAVVKIVAIGGPARQFAGLPQFAASGGQPNGLEVLSISSKNVKCVRVISISR